MNKDRVNSKLKCHCQTVTHSYFGRQNGMFLKAKNKIILYFWPEHKLSKMSAFWPFIKRKIKIVYNNMYLIK